MNYIREINAFYERLETMSLSSAAINLWHGLLHIANKTRWQQEFRIPMSMLMFKTSLSLSTIKRARKELIEKGLIIVKSCKGNLSAIYHMVSLCAVHGEPQSEPQNEPQDEPKPVQNEPQIGSSINNKHSIDLNNYFKTQTQTQKPESACVTTKPTIISSPVITMIPPTVEEVKSYCQDQQTNIDPQEFVDFYTSKGWLIGTSPMRDWRSCLNGWVRRRQRQQQQQPKPQSQAQPCPKNKFNNFTQRQYSPEFMLNLERQLLQKRAN